MYAVLSCGIHGFGGNAEPQLQIAVTSDVHVRGYALHSSGWHQGRLRGCRVLCRQAHVPRAVLHTVNARAFGRVWPTMPERRGGVHD